MTNLQPIVCLDAGSSQTLKQTHETLTKTAQQVLDAYMELFNCRAYGSDETWAMTAVGANYLSQLTDDTDVRPNAGGDHRASPVEVGAVTRDLHQLRHTLRRLAAGWIEAEDRRHKRLPARSPALGNLDWWSAWQTEAQTQE